MGRQAQDHGHMAPWAAQPCGACARFGPGKQLQHCWYLLCNVSAAPACQLRLFCATYYHCAMQGGNGGGSSSNADTTGDRQGPKSSGEGTGVASEMSAAGGWVGGSVSR